MLEFLGRMQQDGKLARALSRRIQDYEKLSSAELSNTYLLEQALVPIKKQAAGLSATEYRQQLQEWCGQQEERIRALKDEFRFRFGTDLKAALEPHGVTLTGQFPILRAGFYTIKLDFDLGHATVYWGPEVEKIRGRAKLAVVEIEKTVVGFDQQLKAHATRPEEFLALLFDAYERHLHRAGLATGTRLLLVDLMREIAFAVQPRKFAINPTRENYREYSRVHFGYDLYRLKQADSLVVKGCQLRLSVATFDSTTEKARSLWAPDNERGEGTYYSYLSFIAVAAPGEPQGGNHR
jgi:hypothetical protein